MLKVSVTNFGPIKEGTVRLRPLTVFVGPNNSGKSYFAMLIYALLHSFREGSQGWHLPIRRWPSGATGGRLKIEREWAAWVADKIEAGELSLNEEARVVRIEQLSGQSMELFTQATSAIMDAVCQDLTRELQRCYGARISELVRRGSEEKATSIDIKQEKPSFSVTFAMYDSKVGTDKPQFEVPKPFEVMVPGSLLRAAPAERPRLFQNYRLLSNAVSRALFKDLSIHVNYLPAARCGILQSYRALSSFVVGQAPLAGIQPIEIPQLSGVVADFIGSLLEIDKDAGGPPSLRKTALVLEREITEGNVDIRVGRQEHPEIFYRSYAAGRLSLHRTSSMVSEVAPIILFLKYVARPGQLLIIEEPEAHLHPENQRRMAKVLAALARAGVKVLLTTHSDYLVQELSNIVAGSKGLTSEDAEKLRPEDVGVYLFKYDDPKAGSVVEEIPVDEEGIKEEEFARVARELYEETVSLRMKALSGRQDR